jgi:hypothetical protein
MLAGLPPKTSRESFLDAAEAICKFWFIGSSFAYAPASTSPTDHRIVESEMMLRAVVDRSTDPPTFRWQPFGDPVVFESTTDCAEPTPPLGAEDQPGPSMQDQKE